jgi:ankyrin repeat protein
MGEARRSRRWPLAVVVFAVLAMALAVWWFSPGQQQRRRNDALFAAAGSGDTNAAKAAIDAGADANARDGNGMTPLMFAAKGVRPNQSSPDVTDHPDVVRLLLERGADVNATDEEGFHALFWAARYGHGDVVKVLIEHGADVNAKHKGGMTALRWATANREVSPPHYDRVIGLLKEAGAEE